MTRLDEIENKSRNLYSESEVWLDRRDVNLLFRAVRQLGATVNMYLDIQESEGDLRTLPYQVDPDVLELFETEET